MYMFCWVVGIILLSETKQAGCRSILDGRQGACVSARGVARNFDVWLTSRLWLPSHTAESTPHAHTRTTPACSRHSGVSNSVGATDLDCIAARGDAT